jgi:hypothetical protein
MSCPNRFMFGEPKKGFHSQRIMGFALYDTLGTIAIALITSYFFKINFWKSLLGWFVLGEILHYAFGTQTQFLTFLGIELKCR